MVVFVLELYFGFQDWARAFLWDVFLFLASTYVAGCIIHLTLELVSNWFIHALLCLWLQDTLDAVSLAAGYIRL